MSISPQDLIAQAKTLTLTCAEGVITWVYPRNIAVTLRTVTLTREAGSWSLTGTIVSKDDYKASQRPLAFVTPNGWRWPVSSLQITDGTLTASLGPKEDAWRNRGLSNPTS